MHDKNMEGLRGVASGAEEANKVSPWKKIWRMTVPGKIKHFMWRLAHNSMAVCVNLQRRGLDISMRCPVCQANGEDGGHLLFKCKQVKEIWRLCGLEEERLLLMDQSTALTMMDKLTTLAGEKQAIIATLMWNWWCERNNRREGGKGRRSEELAWIIEHQTNEFRDIQLEPTKYGLTPQ